jgi:hypothetical protein
MHVYSVEEGEINQEAYSYFNTDYQKLINKIISFNDLFFEILRKGDRYSWVNDPEGDLLQQNMVKMIHMNFNPNLFLERLEELNSGHFKALYFVEEEISMENKASMKKVLEDESVKVNEFVPEHLPIKEIEFLSKQNIGYFRMLSIAQDLLGVVSDENKINSFLDEFKIEYTKLK